MDNQKPTSLHQVLEEVRRLLLHQPGSGQTPSGHDILNALQTVLSSIEMLELDITKPQREVFERLDSGAKQLEELLQAYIGASAKSRAAIVATVDAGLRSE